MDILNSALGQFYFAEQSNSPPIFIQVVGWTKGAENPNAKRRYVYVRKVALNVNHSCIGTGGSWEFNTEIIKNYAEQIKKPIHKNIKGLVDGNAIIIDNYFIRYQGKTLTLKLFDFASNSVSDISIPEVIVYDKDTAIANELLKELEQDDIGHNNNLKLRKMLPL